MTDDKIDLPPPTQDKPWFSEFFLKFLLADGVFIFLRQLIDPIPSSSKFTDGMNTMVVVVSFTGLYLAAFVVGMILALVLGLLRKEAGKKYRSITWMRALILSSFPAIFLLYLAWWGRYHAVIN